MAFFVAMPSLAIPAPLALTRQQNIRIQSGVASSAVGRGVYFTLAGPTEGHSHIGPTPIDAAYVAAAAPMGTTQSRRFDPRPAALLF